MRKVVTRLCFLARASRDRGLYGPLLPSTPSGSRPTMSYTVPTTHPTPEVVLPDVPVIAPPNYDEPTVTRKELWSYYCMSCIFIPLCGYSHNCFPVYYNGDNVRPLPCCFLTQVRILRIRCVLVIYRVLVPWVWLLWHD
jgi:hypothetical protein